MGTLLNLFLGERLEIVVGYAWFFERGVIYGSMSDVLTVRRSKRMRKKLGILLGVVKGLVPRHNQRVCYEYYSRDPKNMQLTLGRWI